LARLAYAEDRLRPLKGYIKETLVDSRLLGEIVDLSMLDKIVGEIRAEKAADVSLIIMKGEVMNIKFSREKTWAFTWDYLKNIRKKTVRESMEGVIILKRGYTVAQLLKRCPRNLDHTKYTNQVVQFIYEQLSGRCRMKTDEEWIQHRIHLRNEALSHL